MAETRITRFGGNPTTYNNNSARILKGKDVMVLRPEGGVEHRMYDDGTMTRVDDRTGESIPVSTEYDAYWRDAFEQAQTNARPNLLQRGVHWVGRGIEKAGDWLQRFENGGTAQQPETNKQKRMQELLLVINGAAKELSTKQPGDNVAYLAQVMQDPQEAELLEAIVAEIPDAQEVIDQVSQLSTQMFKCGGKTKKKVKKGAKGCVPCKKLMKVGGKLINVWSDCEGNIISKHQIGGRLIPKGSGGFQFNPQYKYVDSDPQGLITFDDITNMAGTENQTADYYDPTTKQLMRRTYTQGKWGDPTKVTNYDPNTYDQSKLFKSNYDPIKGVFTDKIAKGHYNYGVSQTISDRASLSTSPLSFKTTTDASGAASSQMVLNGDDARLSWTPQQLNRYLRAKAREEEAKAVMQGQSKTEARQFRRARRDMDRNQVFGYGINKNRDSKYYTFEDGSQYTAIDGGNTYQTLWQQQNKADRNVAKSKKLQQKPGTVTYATTPSTAATGNVAASSTPAFSQTQQKRFNKQGGWLTKFQDGGLAYPKAETMYFDPQTRSRQVITNKKLEGKQLPAGTIITQTTGERMKGFPSQVVESYVSNPANYIYERQIKYGATPAQNDTVYTTRFVGRPMPQMSEQARSKFNNEYYKQ